MNSFDVIVIGGGPAGMFAAGFAGLAGARVLMLEKNRRCGAKILLTGKGRCNVTNQEPDPKKFVEHFGRHGRDFLSALYAFGVQETVAFFESRGLQLRTERGGRIFPANGTADDVLRLLETFIDHAGVKLLTSCPATDLDVRDGLVRSVETSQGHFSAKNLVLATGGLSYPETGCTGDGYRWASASGHRIAELRPALMGLKLADEWTGEVADFNLKNIRISAFCGGKKIDERFGEAFFTRQGIGGPIILDMSKTIRNAFDRNEATGSTGITLSLDLKPALDVPTFDRRLIREFTGQSNRDFRNSLGKLLPRAMIPLFIRLSGIEPDKKCHSITRAERQVLLRLFKELELRVTGYEGFERGIITSGGVSLQNIDMRTMRSKLVSNLFFAGEIVDLDGPTGGFNLQVCWSTGYLAGTRAAETESLPLGRP